MTTPSTDDESRFAAAVQARVALLERARRVVPDGKFDALNDRQIREAVLHKLYGAVPISFPEKSDSYIAGLFEHAVSSGRLDAAGAEEKPTPRADARREPFVADWQRPLTVSRQTTVRADARESFVPDWQKPLSFGRARNASNAELSRSLKHEVKRGGGVVARDAKGRALPDWQQPLSFSSGSPKDAGLGAKPAPLMKPSP